MAFSQKIKDRIFNARQDGCVCLLGTIGQNGPNITPKGNKIIFDDDHLAYWERSEKAALENLRQDDRVIVVYSNMKAFLAGEINRPGIFRFYGPAELYETGPIREEIFSKIPKNEQEHEGAEDGIGVLIKIDHSDRFMGRPIE